ncbi:MAG: TlpA family protein disulfide reductase [Ruminococcaceae bacterium]|nr:TlpA family protein disulfide reductase [Oscillospiraceae bacterium]
MKTKISIIIGVIVFAALLVGAYFLYSKLGDEYKPDKLVTVEQQTEAETGDDASDDSLLAPDFTVIDTEGNEVKLSNFRGKPVVLNFWASWCPPCKSEMPDFNKKYKEIGDKVQFMMVNCTDGSRETVDTAKEFIKSTDYTFPVFFDTKLDASMKYGASSIPLTFFINSKGELVTYATGMLSAADLERGIGMIME